MVYSLTYRRPPYVSSAAGSVDGSEKQASLNESIKSSSTCSMCAGIPEALSFNRIIANGTCPPLTLRDFMNYLKYIEHAAENLQFFLWHRDYTQRFNDLPDSERMLSPEWTVAQADADIVAAQFQTRQMRVGADTAAALKGTGLLSGPTITETETTNPFGTPGDRTPSDESPRLTSSEVSNSDYKSSGWTSSNSTSNMRMNAAVAYDEAGLKWQPFTIQPFRDEIARIVSIYIADGAPRQLNLSSKERAALLHALENTTHPSAFRGIMTTVEWSLRCQAHPNFIRWTICNGNRARVVFARGLGVACIALGTLVGVLITLSDVNRGWRALSFILLFLGISTLIAAWKGMCVVLHGMHHRHLRPWELFQDEDDATVELKGNSVETLQSSNSYEDEPWVARYQKRNTIRKIFDRELWVEEPALRQIQDTIFLQSIIGAFFGAAALTAIFLAVPAGHYV